jgi:hypothetical membrane protein
METVMNARRFWALSRYGLAIALLAAITSGRLYPGGTVLDASTRGYSFTHNFLSDLGSTVAFNDGRNTVGALLFDVAIIVAVLVLAGTFIAVVRLLSTAPRGAAFARLAGVAGAVVCVGFLGVAFTPLDRAFRIHMVSSLIACYSFPVATTLLAVGTSRDGRFRARAMLGWAMLTVVLVSFIGMAHLGPSVATERGVMTQVITQKIMAVSVLVVLWLESTEVEVASGRA